jgi:hypothetical protein
MSKSGAYPSQQPLFREAVSGDVVTWQQSEAPSITLVERAERMVHVLNTLAHRNMLLGLSVGATDPEYQDPIYERYAEGTPIVLEHSRSKVDRLYYQAKLEFWRATGFETLRGTGMLGRKEVAARSDKMWRDFRWKYGHPKVHDELDRFRKSQLKLLPKDHPLRNKRRQVRELHERAA